MTQNFARNVVVKLDSGFDVCFEVRLVSYLLLFSKLLKTLYVEFAIKF